MSNITMGPVERIEEMFPLNGPHTAEDTDQALDAIAHLYSYVCAASHPNIAAVNPRSVIRETYENMALIDELLRKVSVLLSADGKAAAGENLTAACVAIAASAAPLSAAEIQAR